MKPTTMLRPTLVILLSGFCSPATRAVPVTVDPHSTRSIAGESRLDRKRYFGICDSGRNFEQRTRSPERYDYLVNELGIRFGRSLGLVNWLSKNPKILREDPARPGFSDLALLKQHLARQADDPSPRMLADLGPNLDVALHGQHNAYPEFMGSYLSEWLAKEEAKGKPAHDRIPQNVDAAAELAATVLKHGFNDLTRPRFYEPVNEPHWSFLTEPSHIAKWHLATMERVRADLPGTLVGGPCNSVGYLYSKNYNSFKGIRNFIDATGGRMDFYSFHVYDYYRDWQDDQFTGAILSGLPLEGVLDLVPNYTFLKFGRVTPIVISETGGYSPADKETGRMDYIEAVAAKNFPGSGFEREMKVRSIHDFLQINSTIANTLAFMDHPHTVSKAVPFMLLDTSGWNPKYYAALYTPKDFDRKAKDLVPSTLHHFYQLFRDLDGRRVASHCPDPDIPVRSFVDGSRLFIIAHNLATKAELLDISAPEPESIEVRRYGRNPDLTPFLRQEAAAGLGKIKLGARETVVVVASYASPVEQKQELNETIHYGHAVTVPVEGSASIRIKVDHPAGTGSAMLRIGYNRPAGSNHGLRVVLNDSPLDVPVEDSAPRYDHEKHGYSTTKLIPVDPALIQADNSVSISFPDGGEGTIGSAVLRLSRSGSL